MTTAMATAQAATRSVSNALAKGGYPTRKPRRGDDTLLRARRALAKAGFDPSQPRDEHGRWGGSGAGSMGRSHFGSYTGGVANNAWPHVPSNKERELETELHQLTAEHKAMVSGGVAARDPDLMDLEQQIETTSHKLRANRANRQAALAAEKAKTTPPGAQPAANEQQARQNRRSEAERIQAALQTSRERQKYQTSSGTYHGLSEKDASLLNELNHKLGLTSAVASSAAIAAQAAGGSYQTFRGALGATTARLARVVGRLHGIAHHGHKAATATDFAVIGTHLGSVSEHLSALQDEIKALPKDAKALGRQTSKKIKQAKEATARLQQKLKARVGRSRPVGT